MARWTIENFIFVLSCVVAFHFGIGCSVTKPVPAQIIQKIETFRCFVSVDSQIGDDVVYGPVIVEGLDEIAASSFSQQFPIDKAAQGTDVCINDCTVNHRLIKNISDALSLTCTAVNNSQDEELVWLRGDRVINLKPLNRINVSTVCIDPITADDNDITFSCHLSRNSTVKRSVLLDVRFVPILSQDGEVDVEAYSGDVVTLTCNVKSNPPAVMSWYKDNNILKMEAGKHHVNWDSSAFTLLIKKVKKEENGTYVCMADSTLGNRSLYFNLNVKEKPYQVPYEPIIAGIVVILLTSLFGIISRRHKIMECCGKNKDPNACNETQ